MIEFRYLRHELQYRYLFTPARIASGDIVLREILKPEWKDIRHFRTEGEYEHYLTTLQGE